MFKLYVIGFGFKPFTKELKEVIYNANFILASERLFDFFRGLEEYGKVKDKVKVINNVDQTFDFIKSQISNPESRIVLLASGDPLFYGIGRRAVKEFGKDAVEIFPDLSSIQVAFAKIKETWDDAFLMSLHGGPDPSKRRNMPYEATDIPFLLQRHNKIAILTDKENNPARIAQILSQYCASIPIKMFICEKLGYHDEKITEGMPEEIAKQTFRQPNLVILLNQNFLDVKMTQKPASCLAKERSYPDSLLGLSEDDIVHSGGLITKDEIRAIALHKLKLLPCGVFWDIGAGSGSISVEVSRLCPEVKVYAVEKDPVQTANISNNKKKFNLENLHIVEGEAPENLKDLPIPQRVFIGGSGGRLEEIINFIATTHAEIVVINAATIETFNKAFKSLHESAYNVEASQINASRIKRIGEGNYFSALNPVFIIRGWRDKV